MSTTNVTTVTPTATLIPLSKLSVAPENVRRTDKRGGVEGLAESIAAEGLLQNLVAFETESGRFRVVAGGRRLAALKLLAKAGRWSEPVRCLVLPTEAAARVSLAENVMRTALHPADEFEAFAALIAEGHDAPEVARRFGTTVRHVEQRMKLAAVSPALVKAYRAGEMTLDQLMAFTVVDDHARQEQVWTTYHVRESMGLGIRRALLAEHVPVTDKLARFVGLEAYEAAGGAVTRDLFSDDAGGTWLADPDLLRRLAAEKMEAEASALSAEGWDWIETFETFPYSGFYNHGRVYPRALPLSDEDRTELARLTERREAILSGLEAEPVAASAEALSAVEAAIGVVRERGWNFTAEDKARAGVAVGLTHEGRLPGEVSDLWPWLLAQDQGTVLDLLAFLVSLSLNGVKHRHERAGCDRLRHADQVAASASLDMRAWWSTDEAFLSRLSKAQIAAAVAEGAGDGSRELAAVIAKLPKGEAVACAAQALEGRGWLPEPLRTPAASDRRRAEADRIAVEVVRGETVPMHVEAAE